MADVYDSTRGSKEGQWWPFREDGPLKAMLRCPHCGIPAFLTSHTITRDGMVDPEFRCDRAACEFRAVIRLIGWDEAVSRQRHFG